MANNVGSYCCTGIEGKTIKFEESTVTLDHVFDMNAPQHESYEFVGKPIIEDIL